jgi:hypothetical protein
MVYRFKPNCAQRNVYIRKMRALEAWLAGEGRPLHAERASTGTVYFTIGGQRYRVARHAPGFNASGDVISFHAAPTRAPEIAAAILAGKRVDRRGAVRGEHAPGA